MVGCQAQLSPLCSRCGSEDLELKSLMLEFLAFPGGRSYSPCKIRQGADALCVARRRIWSGCVSNHIASRYPFIQHWRQAPVNVNELQHASPEAVDAWLTNGNAILIDVREGSERERERIEDAAHAPLSELHASTVPGDRRKIAVFYCQTGAQTKEASARLLRCGFAQAYQLTGGIEGWRGAGLPTTVDTRSRFPMLRQAQLGAGITLLASLGLAQVSSNWWLLGCLFVAVVSLVHGITGWCAASACLRAMPWNSRPNSLRP